MTFVTGKHLSRRAVLRGLGATFSLPLLDAMMPAGRALARTATGRAIDATRFVAIEIVHGAAGSNKLGASKFLWAPEAVGAGFDLTPSSLSPLERHRDRLTIVSNTDVRPAEAVSAREVGGDHFRSSAAFLTQSRPKQTEGSDIRAGISMDQIYARRFGQDTPIPSMQLSIENVDQSGGCAYGYACVYTDTISWASETEPLPMVRDPRIVFDRLFGSGGSPQERALRRRNDRSILDWIAGEVSHMKKDLGPVDRGRLDAYLSDVREVERRIQRIEAHRELQEKAEAEGGVSRPIPAAPHGVPESFGEHVQIMFDLQVLAFQSDATRVFTFKLGRDGSARIYPESGVNRPFHPASHHGGREASVTDFARINRYHVAELAQFIDKLRATPEGDGNLLDKSLVMYGSPMGDSNLHNHKRCPLILLGGANGKLRGERHLKAPDETPMADVMLDVMHKLGMDDIDSFGDSEGKFTI
jgi:hypothetical protein